MKTNFDINIPSIPSKRIKFKIQDIKSTAFGSQKNRFHENKTFLTKKFIESFNNFQQKSQVSTLSQTRTSNYSKAMSIAPDSSNQYRRLIPEEKKYMLYTYDKYKHYEAPILQETKFNKGFSFYRTNLNKTTNDIQNPRQRNQSLSNDEPTNTENFYFSRPNEEKREKQDAKETQRPTCVFKNQTRHRVYSKLQKPFNEIPGPGAYTNLEEQKPKQKDKPKPNKEDENKYRKLKMLITNIVAPENVPAPEIKNKQEQQQKNNFMFIVDDRDRFGNQKYPIAGRRQVPGPGAYDLKDSLQTKAQKIIVVEQQRKLLKQWFNN